MGFLFILNGNAEVALAEGGGSPHSESHSEGTEASSASGSGESKSDQSEEDDYTGTPYTEYGEFNESNDEDSDTRFFKYGRFFGVSLGMGFQFVDGYRGSLWQGGFPVFDFKIHYWFDFNIAMDLSVMTAQHYYDTTVQGKGHVDVNMINLGMDIKYYFDTRNLSAAISFANPYVLLGAGSFSKTENSNSQQTQDNDTSLGINAGAGLEFTISPKKTYFTVEGKMKVITFRDTYTTIYQTQNLPNLTGFFYSVTGSFLFTW